MFIRKRIAIVIYFIIIFSPGRVCGQEPKFTQYSAHNGLPSSQVHDIVQDRYGYLWFATDGGLSRYDGYAFKNFTVLDGLTDNSLFKFYPQENGDILCTTFGRSVFCISGTGPVFKPYPYNKQLTGLPDYYTSNCLYLAKDSSLFMSFTHGSAGYLKIDRHGKLVQSRTDRRKRTSHVVIYPEKREFFHLSAGEEPEDAHQLSKGLIYPTRAQLLSVARPCYFRKKKCAVIAYMNAFQIEKHNSRDPITVSNGYEPISMGKFNDSLFWVGFRDGGLGIYDLTGRRIRSFLAGRSVTALCIDHEGGYWFSTLNDGVFHASNASVLQYHSAEKANNWISSLARDDSGRLWMGYYNGDVSVFSGERTTDRYFCTEKRPARVEYIASTKKLYFFSDQILFDQEKKDPVYKILRSCINFLCHGDSVFFSSFGCIFILANNALTELRTPCRVNDICFHENVCYLASYSGLHLLKGGRAVPSENSMLRTLKISDIDSWNTKLLIATKDSGVVIKTGDRIYTVTTRNGLSSNLINEVHIQNDSVFWACTNRGINRVVVKNNETFGITSISAREGLPGNEITDVEILRDTAWIGTRQGLCSYPLSLLKNKKRNTSYYLALNCFKVNDSLWASDMNRLRYDQNRIEFGYKAISFTEPEPILYRYKLAGYEKTWQYTQALSSTYASLPPGSYNFIVQVKGANTRWESTQQSFSFIISPPFWQTWWFLLMVAVFLGVVIYLFFRFKILSYNRDITRELLRQVLKRIKRKTNYVIFREQGKDIRIATTAIQYVKADGNYVEIHTDVKKYVIRYKIGEFLSIVPDPLEYVRISRSCIVRLDKIEEKSKKDVTVKGEKIPVGETYLGQLKNIQF